MVAQSILFHKQATQLRLINELSTRLQSLIGSDRFFDEIITLIQNHFHYYGINIWTLGENGVLQLKAQSGAYNEHLKIGQNLQAGQGIVHHVVQTRKSYVARDVSSDPNFTNLQLPVHTQSEVSVPVLKEGAVLAVLNVESDIRDAFDEDDVSVLETVASQIAVAMSNQKLYQDVKSFNQKLQTAVEEKTLELRSAHERILEQQRLLQKENKALKTLVNHSDYRSSEIIGRSPSVLNLLSMVDKIAPTTATVLIQGESGTGKELIAKRLHFKSERAESPFVTVNCSALQESLLESELFGHEKGSFTGAVAQKMGLCETADDGTLFLDEIGEMSLGIQSKLLRFLQEGEFYRIGGKRPIKVNVRIVSATNRDLEKEVSNSRFREDLFYRLNTITLRMPPLRKRKEDIPALIEFFLKHSRVGGAPIKRVDPRVFEVLSQYDWPGNIRELQNTVERMKILAENGEIRIEDIPFGVRSPKDPHHESFEISVEMTIDEIEKQHILRTLAYHQGNKTRTAGSLGITIKTLYNKLHRYGILTTTPIEGDPHAIENEEKIG